MTDVLLDTDFDILIQNGDMVAGESTRQHQTILLLTEKGENREFPIVGVGTQTWLLDDAAGNYLAEVKRQFELDGMKVLQISGSVKTLQVEAVYG